MSPFANFPDFQGCVDAQKGKGHSEDSSKRICGAIQSKIEGKNATEQLSELELKTVNEYVEKFQGDNRPPKEWFSACQNKYEGKVSDSGAYCGYLWWYVVGVQGANPAELLTENPEHIEAFNKTKEFVKQFSETVKLEDEEIFAVGTWNGDKYTHEDLKEIANNFNLLKGEVKPPVKLGHSESQKLLEADDLPAGGWVTGLKVAGDKLIANISDVPRKIYELIKNRAYKRKSAEIYPQYTGADGKKYGKVLRAIAFLGSATPAINTLNDLLARYSGDRKQKFKTYNFNKGGGEKMKTLGISVSSETFSEDFQKKFNEAMKTAFGEEVAIKFEGDTETVEGLKKRIAELEKEIEDYRHHDDEEDMEKMKAKYDETIKTLNETKAKLTDAEAKAAKLADTEIKLTQAQTKLQENEVKAHKAEVNTFIEKAKADGKILPKHEKLLSALLGQIDKKSVIKFMDNVKVKGADGTETEEEKEVEKTPLEMVKTFVESLPKMVEFEEISGDTKEIAVFDANSGKVKIGNDVYDVVDRDLANKAKKYSDEHNVSFDIALIEVSKTK